MSSDLLKQYKIIRDAIRGNVETIGKLINQAEELHKTISSIDDEQLELKEKLVEGLQNIRNLIESLITQTDELFDEYNKFIQKVLK
jgi:hypothetical protein